VLDGKSWPGRRNSTGRGEGASRGGNLTEGGRIQEPKKLINEAENMGSVTRA